MVDIHDTIHELKTDEDNFYFDETDWLKILYEKSNNVDKKNLGEFLVTRQGTLEVTDHYMNRVIQLTVAEALLDNIGQIERHLRVRNLQPWDFSTPLDEAIRSYNVWRQPPYSFNRASDRIYYKKDSQDQTVYLYGHNSHNGSKCICIFGLEDMSLDHYPSAEKVAFYRGDKIKLIDMFDVPSYYTHDKPAPFRKPILCKRSDDLSIVFRLKPGAYGRFDKILFHGIVVENVNE